MKCVIHIIGYALLALSAWCILVNIFIAIHFLATRKSHGSFVPLLGWASGIVGILCIDRISNWYACIAFLDPGAWSLPWLVRELVRDARSEKAVAADEDGFTTYVDGKPLRRILWSQVDFTQFRIASKGATLYLKTTPVEIITIPSKYDGYDSFLDCLKRKATLSSDKTGQSRNQE